MTVSVVSSPKFWVSYSYFFLVQAVKYDPDSYRDCSVMILQGSTREKEQSLARQLGFDTTLVPPFDVRSPKTG